MNRWQDLTDMEVNQGPFSLLSLFSSLNPELATESLSLLADYSRCVFDLYRCCCY